MNNKNIYNYNNDRCKSIKISKIEILMEMCFT